MARVDDAADPLEGSTRRRCRGSRPASGIPTTIRSELYYLPDDFTQAQDLAAQHPEKVKELRSCSGRRPRRTMCSPLLGGLTAFFGMTPPLPKQSKFTYYGDVQNVPRG